MIKHIWWSWLLLGFLTNCQTADKKESVKIAIPFAPIALPAAGLWENEMPDTTRSFRIYFFWNPLHPQSWEGLAYLDSLSLVRDDLCIAAFYEHPEAIEGMDRSSIASHWQLHVPLCHDADFTYFHHYNLRNWPAYVLLKKNGEFISSYHGVKGYEKLQSAIDSLSTNTGSVVKKGMSGWASLQAHMADRVIDTLHHLLYEADWENHCVWVKDEKGRILKHIGQGYNHVQSVRPEEIYMSKPSGLAFNASYSYLFIADAGTHEIWKLDVNKWKIQLFLGNGQSGLAPEDGKLLNPYISLGIPFSLCFQQDSIFIGMAGWNQIWKVHQNTGKGCWFAGQGADGTQDGALHQCKFGWINHMKWYNGDLYFTDTKYHQIRRISGSVCETLAGFENGSYGYVDGFGRKAGLTAPRILQILQDTLTFFDPGFSGIRQVVIRTRQVISGSQKNHQALVGFLPKDSIALGNPEYALHMLPSLHQASWNVKEMIMMEVPREGKWKIKVPKKSGIQTDSMPKHAVTLYLDPGNWINHESAYWNAQSHTWDIAYKGRLRQGLVGMQLAMIARSGNSDEKQHWIFRYVNAWPLKLKSASGSWVAP